MEGEQHAETPVLRKMAGEEMGSGGFRISTRNGSEGRSTIVTNKPQGFLMRNEAGIFLFCVGIGSLEEKIQSEKKAYT